MALLEIENLVTRFSAPGGPVAAVDGLSLTVEAGEVLAIVGESGCGKSVTSLSIMRLLPAATTSISGRVSFKGTNLLELSDADMRAVRGRDIGMVFQEPMTSLNPVLTVGRQITEALRTHLGLGKAEAKGRAIELLSLVGIPAPERRLNEYAHQLSGGMRQRVMIAIALACDPKLLIADEPTTALDVTIQAQIIDLMNDLRGKLGTSIMLITHDLGVVAQMAQRVIVMYAGRVAEEGRVGDIFRSPRHPYTRGLLEAVPKLGSSAQGARGRLAEIPGQVPSIRERGDGCLFAGRCTLATEECRMFLPPRVSVGDGHFVACHHAGAVT